MAEDKPRLARLTAIITQLQSKRMLTAREIAEKYQVSIRTVYRDIRTLEQSGIPIFTEEGRGYCLMEGYKLPPVMFTQEEANALITAEQIIKKNKDQSLVRLYESAVTKIKSTLKFKLKEKAELLKERIQVRNNSENEKTSDYLIQLQTTISNFQVVTINYVSLSNIKSVRKIEPFALYTTKDNWILIAFCKTKNDFRSFRLDCIERLQVENEYFTPHKMTLEQYLESCRENWQATPDIPLTQQQSTFALNQKKHTMQKVKIAPFHLIGFSVRTTNKDAQAAKDIPLLWDKLMTENLPAKISNKMSNEIYSLYTEYESDHTGYYTAMLGCKVENIDNIPEGMVAKSFEGGDYLSITAKGDLDQGLIVNEWAKIWGMELDRAFTADFEIYGEKAMNRNDAEVDILIAIK